MIYLRKVRLGLKDCKYNNYHRINKHQRRSILHMNNMKKDITIELAIKSSDFGIYITYDGDMHKVLCGTNCGLCRDYFESEKIEGYCERCK